MTAAPEHATQLRIRPFRRIRKASKRLGRALGIRLGLLPAPATHGYAICTLARSGSTYFCELLKSTGVLGVPDEYFNTEGKRIYFDPAYPRKRTRQIQLIRTRGATPNGIYGVKVLAPDMAKIGDSIDIFQELPNLKLLRLSRRDIVSQAISLMRARQTKRYWSSFPSQGEAHYDQRAIRRSLRSLVADGLVWDRVLADRGFDVLNFEYEDVVRDPQAAVDRIATLMGLSLPVPIDPRRLALEVMRDEQSGEWRARFLSETGDEFRHLAGD